MLIVLSRPSSLRIWRMASRNGWPSRSPTVPPTSTMTTSAPVSRPTSRMQPLVSLWRGGAGGDVQGGVQLLEGDGDVAALEDAADSRRCYTLADGADHSAGYEYVFR